MPPARLVRFARGGALAFEFTGTIAGSAVLGWLIDGYFETDPYGMIGCILIGAVGGFVRLIQMLRAFDRVDRDTQR
jgi:F0F1-type ATP synthase assembly protein I